MDSLRSRLLEYRIIQSCDEDKSVLLAEKDNNFFVIKKIDQNGISIYNRLKKVNHNNIANIAEIFEDGESVIVVEEHIDGKTIRKSLEEDGLFNEDETADYALQLCSALEFLHKKT